MLSRIALKNGQRFQVSSAFASSRNFASEKELKQRITSVSGITKITKSAQLISSAKVNPAKNNLPSIRGMVGSFSTFWGRVMKVDTLEIDTPDIKDFKLDPEKNYLLVGITADRGLCGGVNSSIARTCRKLLEDRSAKNTSLVMIGERCKASMSRGHELKFCKTAVTGTSKFVPPTFPGSVLMAKAVASAPCDEVVYVWNYFKSMSSYKQKIINLPSFETAIKDLSGVADYEIEGSDTLEHLYAFTHVIYMHYFVSESCTVELSQRIIAMEGASTNGEELVGKLQLVYNRQRQGRITTELSEIISGAVSQEENSQSEF